MGMKHRVEGKVVYVTYGSINPQLAERTGFSDEDAELIKELLPKLFENDASSARPEGSMKVLKVIWWKHPAKLGKYSSAKVHDSLRRLLQPDGSFNEAALKTSFDDFEPEIIDGF
jgi:CRISPR-associated protein Csd2